MLFPLTVVNWLAILSYYLVPLSIGCRAFGQKIDGWLMGDVEKLNIELFQHRSNPLSHHRNYAEWVEYAYPNNATC